MGFGNRLCGKGARGNRQNGYRISEVLSSTPVQRLCAYFVKKFGRGSENCRPFPSVNLGLKCLEYVKSVSGPESKAHLEVETVTIKNHGAKTSKEPAELVLTIAAVLASEEEFEIVKEYWKLRGECVSSRLALSVNQLLDCANHGSEQVLRELEAGVLQQRRGGESKEPDKGKDS